MTQGHARALGVLLLAPSPSPKEPLPTDIQASLLPHPQPAQLPCAARMPQSYSGFKPLEVWATPSGIRFSLPLWICDFIFFFHLMSHFHSSSSF